MPPKTPILLPSLVQAFATAVALWIVALLLNLPSTHLPTPVIAGVLLVVLLVGATIAGRRGLKTAILATTCTQILNLLIWGSVLGDLAREGDQPATNFDALGGDAPVWILGFLALGVVIGALGFGLARLVPGAAPARTNDDRTTQEWVARFAIVATVAVLPVVVLGGLVTSTESGLAVPDWPNTYGSNMFLYPLGLMGDHRIFLEHAHRLFGSFAGLSVLTLTILAFTCTARRDVKIWTAITLALIIVQGVAGGFRVAEQNAFLGVLHGFGGQITLMLVAGLAVWHSPRWQDETPLEADDRDRSRKRLATGALHATLLQLLFGAAFRHLRRIDSPGAMHALWSHVGWAFVVLILALLAGFLLATAPGDRPIRRAQRTTGKVLVVTIGLQFLLGFGALVAVLMAPERPDVPRSEELHVAHEVPWTEVLVATLHQVNGAFVLVATFTGLLWARRVHRLSA